MLAVRIVAASLTIILASPVDTIAQATEHAADLESQIRTLLQDASVEFAAGRRSDAVDTARRAVVLAQGSFEPRDDVRIDASLALSSLLMQIGEMDEAAKLAEAANDGAEANLAHWQARVAATLKFVGIVHTTRGDHAAAEPILERAVELASQTYGAEHPETAKHLGNLAMVIVRLGDNERGRTMLRRTIALWEMQPEPHPVYQGGAMLNLASVELEAGNAEKAFQLCDAALAIYEQAFAPEDPRLHNTIRRYASMLRLAARNDEAAALEARLEALAIDD